MAFVDPSTVNFTPSGTKIVDSVSESSVDAVSRSVVLTAAADLVLSLATFDLVQVSATGAQTLTIPDGEVDNQTIVLYSVDAEDDDITISMTNSLPAADVVLGDDTDSLVITWVAGEGAWIVKSTAGIV